MKQKKLLTSLLTAVLCTATAGTIALNTDVTANAATTAGFLTASDGTLTLTEGYVSTDLHGSYTGAKLTLTGLTGTETTVSYTDKIDASKISNLLCLQMLTDVNAIEIAVKDSKDESRTLNVVLTQRNWYETYYDAAYVALEDMTYDAYGAKLTSNASQSVYTIDTLVGTSTNDGYNTGRTAESWQFLKSTTADDVTTMQNAVTVSYADNVVSVGSAHTNYAAHGYKNKAVADLTNEYYQSLNVNNENTTDETKAKYTDEYVTNIFSSGYVTMDLTFVYDSGTETVETNLINFLGTDFVTDVTTDDTNSSVSWDIHKTGTYQVTSSVSIDQAKVVIDKEIPVANLKDNVLKFTFLPDEAGKSVASWMTVHVRDSADPTKVVTVVYGGQSGGRTKTMVTMYEDVVRNDDWGNYYIYQSGTKTQYRAVGADNWQSYSWDNQIYRRNSSLAVSDGYSSENGLFRYVDSIDEIDTLTLQYGYESTYGMTSIDETRKKYSGARLDKLVDDANVINSADDITAHGEEVFADTYQNVFSSGYVTISVELYYQYDSGKVTAEASEFSGNLIIYEVGGEAITTDMLLVDNSVKFKDTTAPVVNDPISNYIGEDKIHVKSTAYNTSDVLALFTATDNVSATSTIAMQLYNAAGELQAVGETVTFAEGDYIVVTATDEAGNVAERTFALSLVHSWVDATCTAPKTCSVCNETEGDALGHTWVEATCTAPKTCSVCNVTEGDALGHTWVEATCTAPKTCSVCNVTEGDALGHTWVEATCTTPKTCSVCNVTEGDALGHTWVDATCTTPKTCSVCNATDGDALGHTWVDATCTTPKTCSVCNATEGDALGHTWVEATCTAPKTCSVCNATDGDALGHTWVDATCTTPKTCSVCNATDGDALGHTWVDATCTTPKTCSVCNATDGDALGHTWVEATCTAPKICSVCNETEGDALGHAYGEVTYIWSEDNTTCTATRTCANDGTHVETETVNAVKTVTQEATTSQVELSKFVATFENQAFVAQTKENVQTGDMLPNSSEPDSSEPESSEPDSSATDSSEQGAAGCFGSMGSISSVFALLAVAGVAVAMKRRKET